MTVSAADVAFVVVVVAVVVALVDIVVAAAIVVVVVDSVLAGIHFAIPSCFTE